MQEVIRQNGRFTICSLRKLPKHGLAQPVSVFVDPVLHHINLIPFGAEDPIPPMPLHPEVQDYNKLLPIFFADLFGDKADHHCLYRELVFDFMAHELRHHTTESLAGPSVLISIGQYI